MKSLALISGKGGSGKTTLGLSIASLLSKCESKVVLIDCDLNTNGATYFFEDKLNDNQSVISFDRLIKNGLSNTPQTIIVNEYFDFIPSVIHITKENTASYVFSSENLEHIDEFQKYCQENYDIVIFDCQSGYADVFKWILPQADIILVVMEADKISMAALRSLYIKIHPIIDDSKVFQVFNKVGNDQKVFYSKLTFGGFFVNEGAILYEELIRRAFAVSKLPKIDEEGAKFGLQICEVCDGIIQDDVIKAKIMMWSLGTNLKVKEEEYKKAVNDLKAYNAENRKQKIPAVLAYLFSLISLLVSLGLVFVCLNKGYINGIYGTAVLFSILFSLVSIFTAYLIREVGKVGLDKKIKTDRIQQLKKECNDLENRLYKV